MDNIIDIIITVLLIYSTIDIEFTKKNVSEKSCRKNTYIRKTKKNRDLSNRSFSRQLPI